MVARDGIEPPTPAFSVLIIEKTGLNTRVFRTWSPRQTPLGLQFMPDKQAYNRQNMRRGLAILGGFSKIAR